MKEAQESVRNKNLETMNKDMNDITAASKLEQLVKEGYHTYECKSLKQHKIILKSLSARERAMAYDLAAVQDIDLEGVDLDSKDDKEVKRSVDKVKDQYERNKWALVAYALVSIDGREIDMPKEEVFEMLAEMNGNMPDILYLEYQKMQNEYFSSIADMESFKKK